MAQTGYTPIQLYLSSTAAAVPLAANLAAGELAINTVDGKLYYKSNAGVVTLLASTSGASGDVVGPASSTDNALARFDLTTGKLIQNSVGLLSDAGILTGLTGITSSGSITLSSLTSGRVTYAGTGGLLQDSANLTFNGTTLTAGGLTTTGTTSTGVLSVTGNTTLGDAAADTVTVNGTITSNLIFTDNTYNIGANGATRPASGWFSRTLTVGQGTNQNWQILAVDYGNATGGGIADGIYINSIKAGTYQGIGFDTRYENAGSWAASQTVATIVDGYQGNFRVFTNSGLTAGVSYTPALRFSIDSTGLAEFRSGVADPSIVNSITLLTAAGGSAYGGVIGQRSISGDQRQGLFVKGTGSLTLLSLYNIDFLAGQTSVPLAADTGLAMRITATGKVAIGNTSASAEGLLTVGSGTVTDKNGIVMNRGAVGSVSTIQVGLYNELNGISTGETLTMRSPNGYKWQNYNGGTEWARIDGSTGYLLVGTASNEARLTVSGGAFFGQLSPKTRYVSIGTTGFTTMRYDDNGYGVLTLQNLGITAANQGFRIIGQFSNDGTATYNGGYIMFATEDTYTGTTSTQDSAITFATVLNGTQGERGRFSSGGAFLLNTQTAENNYGYLQIYQQSSGSISSLGFIGTDNATISSKYSLVFQIDSLSAQSGRSYTWKHNGKGYSDGDVLMTLDADTNQLQVGTTQTFNDSYAGTTYPGVASANGVAYASIGGGASGSLVSKVFNTAINNTYTVRVYPSDTTYDVLDIRVGGYQSSGSGSGSAFFCYGGHVGAYQLNTVFNSYTGNVTISAPSVAGSYVQFTVTIANSGSSGVFVVKVSDAGATAGKTAFITVT